MNHLPTLFIQRLQRLYPQQYEAVLETFHQHPLPTFRINTLKVDTETALSQLNKESFIIEEVPWYPDAYMLKNKSLRELTETALFSSGTLYIQNLSSMLPALILNPQMGEKVLDIAAAPGSKTTQLATLMQNTGEIVANDISRERLYKLKRNLEDQGVTNTTVTLMPGEALWKKYPEYFDKTLVDAPCSMEGLFQSGQPKSYNHWTEKKVKILAKRQCYLLRAAVAATKPGGSIVYSTCTLSPEENEGVIDWILKKEGEALVLDQVSYPGLSFHSGITQWNQSYSPEVSKTARIVPTPLMEGFFLAKIKKLRPTTPYFT